MIQTSEQRLEDVMGDSSGGKRNVGVAMDLSPTSKFCFAWTLDHIARDGDQVIVLIVKKKEGEASLFEKSGTPMIPLHDYDENVLQKYGLANNGDVIGLVKQAREQKKITVYAKIFYGDAREKLLDAIGELKLDLLAIGSRGLGTVKRALLGSVSNYVINNAPCPVTVVKNGEPA